MVDVRLQSELRGSSALSLVHLISFSPVLSPNITIKLSSAERNVTGSSTTEVYLAGSSLTITCDIDIPVSVNTPFSVLMEWTRNGVPPSGPSRVNITTAIEIFSKHYQTQLFFSTLSSSEDRGGYTCAITVTNSVAQQLRRPVSVGVVVDEGNNTFRLKYLSHSDDSLIWTG